MALKRMDNVGIVVDDLGGTIDFFRELGLELEGRATIEGEWAGRVTGLGDQRVEIAMMRTPDGHGRLELSRFLTPPAIADHRNAPVNALGYLRVMFAVDDIDEYCSFVREQTDLRLGIDWSAFYWVPADVFGTGKVVVFGTIIDKDGEPYAGDMRGVLKRYADKLSEEKGWTLNAANEIEGFLFAGLDAEKN